MLSDIPYKNQRKIKPEERISKRFSFWFITIWIIIGMLIVITVVFSIASCKEQRRLERERAALQKSRDSLEKQLIIIPPMSLPAAPSMKEGDIMPADFPMVPSRKYPD